MAAGLGFKTFTTGEVLTAADVNGYLMQGVLVFASEAARDAAITSPQEGQFAYTKDNNSLWYYTGSAWAASGATGDIEGVTAGTGISGGGTSGTVTITNSMATAIDAKGDLVAGTGADTFARLAVGSNGQALVAASGETTGLKWGNPNFVGAAAYMSNNSVSYTQNVQATMSFTNEDYDSDGFWTSSPNPSRLTIPTGKGGKYLISALWRTVVGSDNARLFLKKNGSVITSLGFESGHFVVDPSMALNNTALNASVVLDAVATDYFELTAQTSFATQTSATWCRFSISYLGA